MQRCILWYLGEIFLSNFPVNAVVSLVDVRVKLNLLKRSSYTK